MEEVFFVSRWEVSFLPHPHSPIIIIKIITVTITVDEPSGLQSTFHLKFKVIYPCISLREL